jgi:protein involved in polysaccharide export with SLBB domain
LGPIKNSKGCLQGTPYLLPDKSSKYRRINIGLQVNRMGLFHYPLGFIPAIVVVGGSLPHLQSLRSRGLHKIPFLGDSVKIEFFLEVVNLP